MELLKISSTSDVWYIPTKDIRRVHIDKDKNIVEIDDINGEYISIHIKDLNGISESNVAGLCAHSTKLNTSRLDIPEVESKPSYRKNLCMYKDLVYVYGKFLIKDTLNHKDHLLIELPVVRLDELKDYLKYELELQDWQIKIVNKNITRCCKKQFDKRFEHKIDTMKSTLHVDITSAEAEAYYIKQHSADMNDGEDIFTADPTTVDTLDDTVFTTGDTYLHDIPEEYEKLYKQPDQ